MKKGKSNEKNEFLPIGGYVLTYNRWTGFDSRGKVGKFFRKMTIEEVQAINKGDLVWADEDPIHPNGKVYGFLKSKVDKVEQLTDGDIRIYYGGGFTTVNPKDEYPFNRFFVVEDESGLAGYISKNPLATQVLTEESVSLGKEMGVL